MTRAVVLVALCVALAGCAKKNDTPTSDTNGTATTTTSTSVAPTNSTGGTNSTTSGALPAKDVCTINVDFTPTPAAPGVPPDPNAVQNPTQTRPCPGVPAGYKTITLKVTWTLATPAFAGPAAPSIKLVDPAKSSLATCAGPNPGDQNPPKACEAKASSAPAAGDYQVVATGSGTASAKAVVTIG